MLSDFSSKFLILIFIYLTYFNLIKDYFNITVPTYCLLCTRRRHTALSRANAGFGEIWADLLHDEFCYLTELLLHLTPICMLLHLSCRKNNKLKRPTRSARRNCAITFLLHQSSIILAHKLSKNTLLCHDLMHKDLAMARSLLDESIIQYGKAKVTLLFLLPSTVLRRKQQLNAGQQRKKVSTALNVIYNNVKRRVHVDRSRRGSFSQAEKMRLDPPG